MTTKSTLITIAIALVALLVMWYLSSVFVAWSVGKSESKVADQSDTTQNISIDLMAIPNDSSVNKEFNSLNQDIQDF